jgi:Flp pilus assembly CpaF family ATPase
MWALAPAGEVDVARRVRERVGGELAERARAREAAGEPPLSAGDRRALAVSLLGLALEAETAARLTGGRPPPSRQEDERVRRAVLDGLFGLGGLQPLLDDPQIENINVNGADVVSVRYADGRREARAPVAGSDGELVELVRTAAARLGVGERRFDAGAPRVSLLLPDGSRLFAVMAVTARPCVAIRRHRYRQITLNDLVRLGTVSPQLAGMLSALVRAKKNVVITGGTGYGKTTVLRGLAGEIPAQERLVTIEDSLELGLDTDPAHPDCVAMQAREPNTEGAGEVPLAELVRWALRMSPDRVIVGEIRGAEVVPMCNAMSQGNDGSMATLHASSSAGAFAKLAAYAVQGPEQLPLEATCLLVAAAVHFVVHLDADPAGRRVVSSVREVVGADGPRVVSNEVWRPGPDRRAVPGVPLRTATAEELAALGAGPGGDRWPR